VSFSYGWQVEGAWTTKNLNNLLDSASNFASYINKIMGGNGTTWIRNHVGNAVLHLGTIPDFIMGIANANGMVPTKRDVLLPNDFGDYTLIHEMGHVVDNNVKGGFLPATYFGGGPADAMVSAMGGNPGECIPRFKCGWPIHPENNQWYVNNISGSSSWTLGSYGNHSVSDDFADTYTYTIMSEYVPSLRLTWMINFLNSLP
jgi:hypothetical protein